MREPIPGTIARGQLITDSEYFQGIQSGSGQVTATATAKNAVFTGLQDEDKPAAPAGQEAEPNWVTEFPAQINVNAELLKRGQAKFEIYCSVCHGYAGNGDGLVNTRALSLAATGKAAWTAAKSLHDPQVKENPVGRIYDTITNGRSSMGPYKSQISTEDRWAIVAYVQALQATGIKPPAGAVAADDANAKNESSKP